MLSKVPEVTLAFWIIKELAQTVHQALRHAPPGTHIRIRLEDSPKAGPLLFVEDDGPGIAETDLPRLTDRFYRGERSRTTRGNGLGLSLVSAVAELHGAELSLTAMKPGLRVSLAFPANRVSMADANHALCEGGRSWSS